MSNKNLHVNVFNLMLNTSSGGCLWKETGIFHQILVFSFWLLKKKMFFRVPGRAFNSCSHMDFVLDGFKTMNSLVNKVQRCK